MADKKLNEVTKVTDMAYVPVIMADGSIGQIAKADLASVVAGLFSYGILGNFDIDGVYRFCWLRVQGTTAISASELPFGAVWFYLINIPINGTNSIQIAVNQTGAQTKIRTKWDGTFNSWISL